jgi:hypothetical protein
MTRFLKFLGLAAALVALVTVPAYAQVNPFRVVVVPSNNTTAVSTSITAVDTAPALLIKYVGAAQAAGPGSLAVTTDDFIFTTDGTTADATINVQATTPCGATPGTLDTGDADCNTVTELLNEINASANWVAVPLGVIGTDDAGAYFKDLSETNSDADGIPVYNDSATTLHTTNAFTFDNTLDIRQFLNSNTLKANPWLGFSSVLEWYIQNFVGTTATGLIYAVTGNFSAGKVYTESVRTIYSFAGAGTGADKELDFRTAPPFVNPGERLVFRGVSAATHTSPVQRARGFLVAR